MSPPPHRLTFAVSTSLLSASLSLGVAGCTAKGDAAAKDKSDKPDKPEETKTVNEGPERAPDEESVNPGPEPTPKPPPDTKVNPGPEGVKPEAEPEKHVNVRPQGDK